MLPRRLEENEVLIAAAPEGRRKDLTRTRNKARMRVLTLPADAPPSSTGGLEGMHGSYNDSPFRLRLLCLALATLVRLPLPPRSPATLSERS